MFFIITPIIEELQCFELLICIRINMYLSYLYVKLDPVEQQRHKVVPVMSIEFDLLLLVSLQLL